MKQIPLLALLLTLFSGVAMTQDFDYGVRWGLQVLKPDEYVGYPGKQVQAVVMYKDKDGNVIYTESHEGTLDDFSTLGITIGHGMNPVPADRIKPEKFKDIVKFCATVTVQTDEGPKILMVEVTVTSVPRANVAAHALNAEAVQGHQAIFNTPMPIDEFLLGSPTKVKNLVALSIPPGEQGTMNALGLNTFIRRESAPLTVSGKDQEYLQVGAGSRTPLYFGSESPEELQNYLTIEAFVDEFLHALAVEVFGGHSPKVSHNSAAIFANNAQVPMSAGVLANAQTWGVFGTAANGVLGFSTGAGNGAGIWGAAAQAPADGGYKYGLFGNSQNFTGAWGAAIFGNGFHTGTWSMSSDARLKTEVRSQSNALDKIMQLRPAQYRYRQDTPYSLPDGIHHGFIAQEMEAVLPELVSDVVMPLSTDSQDMYTSGTVEYKAINYIEIIAILTSAVQELNSELLAQKEKITELESALLTANRPK